MAVGIFAVRAFQCVLSNVRRHNTRVDEQKAVVVCIYEMQHFGVARRLRASGSSLKACTSVELAA